MTGSNTMAMNTPSAWTLWLSLALVVAAIVSTFVHILFVSVYALCLKALLSILPAAIVVLKKLQPEPRASGSE
jgi:hypothetical protein